MRAFDDDNSRWRRFHGHGNSPASLTVAGSLSRMKKMAPRRVHFPPKFVAGSEGNMKSDPCRFSSIRWLRCPYCLSSSDGSHCTRPVSERERTREI
jgi:hypothetical protein